MYLRMLCLIGLGGCLALVSTAAEQGVRPVGVYPFLLPGQSASPGSPPKAHLWCQGASLIGIVVPDEKATDCERTSPKRPAAIVVRDGRCEPDGTTVSFGFLLSRKAWVYESSGRVPDERTVWLLHRFEGSLKDGQMKGALVQVDVNHPGYAFQKSRVEVDALTAQQATFADESAWRSGIGQAYCLATGEP